MKRFFLTRRIPTGVFELDKGGDDAGLRVFFTVHPSIRQNADETFFCTDGRACRDAALHAGLAEVHVVFEDMVEN